MDDDLVTQNAVIEAVTLNRCEGFLTAVLTLDYGGSGQGFGTYVLCCPKPMTPHRIESVAGHFICRVLEVAGVMRWEDLKGKAVRVRQRRAGVEAIGHIIDDDWFCPKRDFAEVNNADK